MSTVAYGQDHLWRTLYRAAIFEPDLTEIPWRIAEAEKEIVHRARELFRESFAESLGFGDIYRVKQFVDLFGLALQLVR